MKKQSHDVKQAAASLMQISASNIIPAESKKVIDAFLAQDPDDENLPKLYLSDNEPFTTLLADMMTLRRAVE